MRRRLVVAIAGVATAAVVLFAVPLGLVLAHSYRDRELLRLQRDTVAATRRVDVARPGGDRVELPASSDLLAVYDRSGRLVEGRGPARADALVREVLRSGRPADRAADGGLSAAAPLVAHERVAGVLRAQRSDAAVENTTRQAWLAIGVLAAALVAGATLAAVLLARRLARPLERLSVAARRLGDGEFATRSPRSSIREADEIAAALDATAERLHELVARERAFSADASHQLRTPLAALRVELEALELRGDESEELRAALRAVDRLQSTVDTLLAVARDAPRGDATTELGSLLDELEPAHRAALAADARPLRLSVPRGLGPARAQPNVVREIVDVLLSNAVEHGRGAVTVTVRAASGWQHLSVHDEGTIDRAADDVFGRRTGAGHGIGLALARSLAHAEDGRLALGDCRAGTTFELTLPAAEAPVPVG
jgi:signal transduction histidine kinase